MAFAFNPFEKKSDNGKLKEESKAMMRMHLKREIVSGKIIHSVLLLILLSLKLNSGCAKNNTWLHKFAAGYQIADIRSCWFFG